MTNNPNRNAVDFSQLPEPVLGQHKEWGDLYRFAWRLAAASIREIRGRRFVDNAWDRTRNYQWVWDTSFTSLYCRYGAGQYPALGGFDNFYELQREDGYISMTYDMTTGQEPYPDRINPPLFAWAEWEYYRTTGDASRFERVVPHIERLMTWIDLNRRTRPHRRRSAPEEGAAPRADFQLYFFRDCGSSGMDNSPRTPRNPDAGQYFDWIDLSSQMALSFLMLSRMQAVLGRGDRAQYWKTRARELGALINDELWCETTRFYHDRSLPLNFVGHKTAAGFWPILAEICPADRLDALVGHLLNEKEFNRPIPVPTLSADDPNYSPQGCYWLGGVWAPTNYMIARGLTMAGRGDTAHGIAVKYVSGLARTYAGIEPHTLWEANSPEKDTPATNGGGTNLVKPDFVGWSAIGPIAMLIENILGLQLDTPRREVRWDIRLLEEHGLRHLAIGEGHADFLCELRSSGADPARLHIQSSVPITVHLRRGEASRTITVVAGQPAVLQM